MNRISFLNRGYAFKGLLAVLMGDNSVDKIPPALDNGEPNSTMANQIA